MSDDEDLALELPSSKGACAFCDYLAGKRPYTVLWREERVAVLVTREQRGIAHLLVLPVRHVPSLLHLSDDEAGPLMSALRDAGITIDDAYERPGLAVWQNNGVDAHQAIPHLHFHIAGTLPGGGTDFGDVPELSVAETDWIGRNLVASIPATETARPRRVFPHAGR